MHYEHYELKFNSPWNNLDLYHQFLRYLRAPDDIKGYIIVEYGYHSHGQNLFYDAVRFYNKDDMLIARLKFGELFL